MAGPNSLIDAWKSKADAVRELSSALVAMTAMARDYAPKEDSVIQVQIQLAQQVLEKHGFTGQCSPQ